MQRLRFRKLPNGTARGIASDPHGRLYDAESRQALSRVGRRAEVEPLEALAALRLAANRVHSAMQRWTEAHGLSESRLRVLMALDSSPDRRRPLGELAELLDVVPRTITGVADVLERDGLIRRTPDADDRRSVHAQLTPRGRERVESLRRDALARQAALFSGFDREETAQLRHLCLRLVQRLSQTEGGS